MDHALERDAIQWHEEAESAEQAASTYRLFDGHGPSRLETEVDVRGKHAGILKRWNDRVLAALRTAPGRQTPRAVTVMVTARD